MNPQKRRIFAIIVHYGEKKKLQEAIKFLLQGNTVPGTIIVVNHSGEQPKNPCDSRIRWVTPGSNGGYGAGINVGLGVVYSLSPSLDDIIIVMNNDILVNAQTIQRINDWFSGGKTAVLGPTIQEGSQKTCSTSSVNPLNGRARIGRSGKLKYLHGAFIAAPYSVYLKIGGWPEKYFMYWEDVLFGLKVTKSGLPIVCSLDITVKHLRSSNRYSQASTYYRVRNGANFMETETSPALRVWWFILNRLRLSYHLVFNGPGSPVTVGLWDSARGRLGKKDI